MLYFIIIFLNICHISVYRSIGKGANTVVYLGSTSKPYCLEPKVVYSSSGQTSNLPGFYPAYPPTPPKDTVSDDPGRPSNSEDYLQSSVPSVSSNSEDLMSSELKPNPESLMFPSFPYTSRKLQEGSSVTNTNFTDQAVSPGGTATYAYFPPGESSLYGGYSPTSSVFNKGLQCSRQRAKVRSNTGKRREGAWYSWWRAAQCTMHNYNVWCIS